MSVSKEVIVLRHGESLWNKKKAIQAGDQIEDDPLVEAGQAQAKAVRSQFGRVAIDLIVSSAYLRARQTADIVNETVKAPVVIPLVRDNKVVDLPPDGDLRSLPSLLREVDAPTELAGLGYDDPKTIGVKRRLAELHAVRSPFYPYKRHYSDEENLFDLWRRAEMITRYLEQRPERRILVVAHGGIIKVWLAHALFGRADGTNNRLATVKRPWELRSTLRDYKRFADRTWVDNTGFVSLTYDEQDGWKWPFTSIPHLGPLYPNIMPRPEETGDESATGYLE